jgi:hypothetical protein
VLVEKVEPKTILFLSKLANPLAGSHRRSFPPAAFFQHAHPLKKRTPHRPFPTRKKRTQKNPYTEASKAEASRTPPPRTSPAGPGGQDTRGSRTSRTAGPARESARQDRPGRAETRTLHYPQQVRGEALATRCKRRNSHQDSGQRQRPAPGQAVL